MPVELRFDERFFSHKFRSSGLKFEVAICIQTGDIVWINGPFRCGANDITIARQALIPALDDGEMAEADGGYGGESFRLSTPHEANTVEEFVMKGTARHRHETANRRMKIFQVLTQPFRHDLTKHSSAFRAVAVITQLNIQDGFPLFDVDYFELTENFLLD